MRILSAAQMRRVDQLTTERFGISQAQLMENAAHRVLETLAERWGPLQGRTVSLLCGKGNNGGDGLALARLLQDAGANADVYLFAAADQLKDLPRINWDRLLNRKPSRLEEVHSETDWGRWLPAIRNSHCVVDALLGTGISKPLEGFLLFIAQSINALGLPVVSVDVPSGLLSDDVATASLCVQAALTVTFTAPKIGMVLGPNASAVGEMVVASIGSPPELVEQSGSPFSLMTRELLAPFQKERPLFSHKGDFGKILIVSGSRGKSGAAILAGHAALRSGAGLVTLAVPSTIQDAVMAAAPPELMTAGLASTAQGALAPSAGKQILRLLEDFDVVAIGPGLGTGSGAVSAVWEVVNNSSVPVVADADAVNALTLLKRRWKSISPLVLTPHLGEMGRLVNRSAHQVFAERLALAADFPRRHDCHLVLKGFRSMVSDPRGEVWVNSTGNPGMATAGSGDALTGIIAAFVARTLRQMDPSLHDAVAAAVYLHGAAGDAAMSQLGQESLMAGDIIRFLPEVLKFPRA